MKRKIAAILAADIAGYSKLVSEDEEETVRRLASYRGTFEDFVSQKGGRIFNTAGDAVLAEFPSAVEALRCAVDIQESVRTRNMAYPASRQMVFRIGISIGDVVERDGDLLGDGVNVAARLQALAKPGGICVARSVYEQVANKLSLTFADVGPQNLKNIATPVHAYFVAMPSADAERPPQLLSRNVWTGAGLVGVAALLVAVAIGLKQRTPTPGYAHIETRVGAAAPLSPETASPGRATTATGSEHAPLPAVVVEVNFWNSVRGSDDPVVVQSYLDRYPAGQFASVARQKIAALREPPETAQPGRATTAMGSERAPLPAPVVEVNLWNSVRGSDDLVVVQSYLDRYPAGQFASVARQKIAALRELQETAMASKSEAALGTPEPVPAAEPPAIPQRPAPQLAVAAASAQEGRSSAASTPTPEKNELARLLQQQLKRVGCLDAEADGSWGQKSRTALRDFARYAKLGISGDDPDVSLLDAAAAAKSRVCPLVCDGDEVVHNGRCASKPRPPRAREREASSGGRPRARAERTYEERPSSSGTKVCFGAVRNEIVPCK
jgi:class 3 adenylate cyclase